MLFFRVMLGFGEGATFPVSTQAMSDWTPKEKRAFAQEITHASVRLGNALTPPLVARLIVAVTWRGSFIFLGIISVAWVIGALAEPCSSKEGRKRDVALAHASP